MHRKLKKRKKINDRKLAVQCMFYKLRKEQDNAEKKKNFRKEFKGIRFPHKSREDGLTAGIYIKGNDSSSFLLFYLISI